MAVTLIVASAFTVQEPQSKKLRPLRPGSIRTKLGRPKLTPQQEHGLLLLKVAQAEATGLQPDMRAFVLWQVSHGYVRIDSVKVDSLLKDAFLTTLSIEDGRAGSKDCSEAEFCGVKDWLQKHILREMIERSRSGGAIQSLLASAEPRVREMLGEDLFQHYIDEKEFDRARQLLNQFAEQNYFPYDHATELMMALPRERAADRVAIFFQALNSFTQHSGDNYPQSDDLATMVFRFWRGLPEPVVLEAVDQVLEGAKEADKTQPNLRVGISTNKSDAYFASQYEFRLFQLLPVLQELDKPRAESLLRENRTVEFALRQYPQGLTSMAPASYRDKPLGKGEKPGIQSVDVVTIDNTAEAAVEQIQHEISRRQGQILTEAEKDLKQALSDALSLPLNNPLGVAYCPRAVTLRQVARLADTKDPALSEVAMQEMRKIVDNMPLRNQAQLLADSPEIYLRAGDEDVARKALNELVVIAGKLYNHDSDFGDPNQAFKGMWPSANLWRRCIQFAARLTPSTAEEIIAQIPDAEIKTFGRVALAISLLGAESPPLSIMEKHMNESHIRIVP
jgi:hypothetical protein